MQYCPVANYHHVIIPYGKVFGGDSKKMFWLFPENASISERIVNRALIVHATIFKFCIDKKKILSFHFRMYQNCFKQESKVFLGNL